ncbi:DUF6361 family protein [Cupriavidus necator]|uniref:DUF6361 family protein n=1 Tax=Cupriavidus necator TaxID=106590 RepID=UPI003ECE5080
MPSSLTWLDHDSAARDRSFRLLALFREKESRDELGIGGIRDAIADQLFPGTSTIQTRLRYMLFVPWVYGALEKRHIAADRFEVAAREQELGLAAVLARSDASGVFGKEAGTSLKRLPSSVYWAGLGSWGLRRFEGGQQDYYRQVDRFYPRRQRHADGGDEWELGRSSVTWHPHLMSLKPKDFPQQASFDLTPEESDFMIDRWRATHPDSLLTWLALDLGRAQESVDASFPWLHPRFGAFPESIRQLLDQARLFALLIDGAALIYNLQLAEKSERQHLVNQYAVDLDQWQARANEASLPDWDLETFWPAVMGKGHGISSTTKGFVKDWHACLCLHDSGIGQSTRARLLVMQRESRLKGPRSRFSNRAALSQWGGASGLTPLSYRWHTARQFLTDLKTGLNA